MKPFAAAFLVAAVCGTGARAQAPPPSENTSSDASLAGGTVVNAMLNSSIDSKKAKVGEQITAHTTEAVKSTDGRTILPNGTKLIGHVTEAEARSNGQPEAKLAIQFDKAVLKDKQEMPLNVVIQAVAAPAQTASAGSYASEPPQGTPTTSSNPSMSGSRGARPDSTPTAQPDPGATPNGAPSGQGNSGGPLPANMRGAYGLDGNTHGGERKWRRNGADLEREECTP